jgi:hypothetical protein
MAYVFGTILVLGFLSVHFLPKQRTIAIPKLVNRNRLAYVGIALSSFVLMILFGNRMGDIYPNSPLTHAVKAIDHAIFPDNSTEFADINNEASQPDFRNNYDPAFLNNTSSARIVFASFSNSGKETIEPSTILKRETRANLSSDKKLRKLERRKTRMMNFIQKHRKAFAAGISVGAILLIVLLGILTCAGICLIIAGISGSAGLIPLGAAVAGGSIWGIIKLAKGTKQKNEAKP